jgi:hypothetical protein
VLQVKVITVAIVVGEPRIAVNTAVTRDELLDFVRGSRGCPYRCEQLKFQVPGGGGRLAA